jgi:hypothetical protein
MLRAVEIASSNISAEQTQSAATRQLSRPPALDTQNKKTTDSSGSSPGKKSEKTQKVLYISHFNFINSKF